MPQKKNFIKRHLLGIHLPMHIFSNVHIILFQCMQYVCSCSSIYLFYYYGAIAQYEDYKVIRFNQCQNVKKKTFFPSAHVWTNQFIPVKVSLLNLSSNFLHSFFFEDPRRSDMKFCLIVLCLPLIVSGLNNGGFHYPKAQLIRYHFCKKI